MLEILKQVQDDGLFFPVIVNAVRDLVRLNYVGISHETPHCVHDENEGFKLR
jgi:hypothetical protein